MKMPRTGLRLREKRFRNSCDPLLHWCHTLKCTMQQNRILYEILVSHSLTRFSEL
jgi:hypothetical protein